MSAVNLAEANVDMSFYDFFLNFSLFVWYFKGPFSKNALRYLNENRSSLIISF